MEKFWYIKTAVEILLAEEGLLFQCFRRPPVASSKRLRSSMLTFNWKENRRLCWKCSVFDTRHPERNKVHNVATLPIHDKLLECCGKREGGGGGGGAWASEAQNLLHGCINLVAAEAINHVDCYS